MEKRPFPIRGVLYGVVALVLALCLWLALAPREPAGPGLWAVIRVDNREVWRGELDALADQEFSIREESGRDITFQVAQGAIRFLHSDCPDKVCVNTGFLDYDGGMATCLPNRTVLTVELG